MPAKLGETEIPPSGPFYNEKGNGDAGPRIHLRPKYAVGSQGEANIQDIERAQPKSELPFVSQWIFLRQADSPWN